MVPVTRLGMFAGPFRSSGEDPLTVITVAERCWEPTVPLMITGSQVPTFIRLTGRQCSLRDPSAVGRLDVAGRQLPSAPQFCCI
jgi:hypothetical protein